VGDGGQKGLVVALGSVGVGAGESTQGPVDFIAAAEVAGDHGGSAGASVAFQQQAADPGVVGQGAGADPVDGDGAFHVPELSDVVLVVSDGGPSQQRIADGL
jgi:hypothetical protein